MSEPHVKHFTLERYKELYELRERGNVLARIIFTIGDAEIILLSAFVKKQARDTEKALDQSIKMLSLIREHPDCAVKFKLPREVADMTLK